jgi:hypothetical protein
VLSSGILPVYIETSCGQVISVEVGLLLWLGKLYACRNMKEVWVYWIYKQVTTTFLLNSSGTYIRSRTPYGIDGYITSI